MCRYIETIRYDSGQYFNLDYHMRRVAESAPLLDLSELLSVQKTPSDNKKYKCRIVYTPRLVQSIEFVPYSPRRIEKLKLIYCDTIDYSRKYADRELLEQLYSCREDCDDILVIRNGYVTDTSFSNILFCRDGNWFTPSTFLLNGTMRQSLLSEGTVRECSIRMEDIPTYTHFALINAMLPFSDRSYVGSVDDIS